MVIRLYFVATVNGLMKTSAPFKKWVPKDSHDLYIENLTKTDVCIVGSKTYAVMREEEFVPGVEYIVLSRNPDVLPKRSSVRFFSGNIHNLVDELKSNNVKQVAVLGGAEVAGTFLNEDLVDELALDIVPVIDGVGRNFISENIKLSQLSLKSVHEINSGTIQIVYKCK